VAAHREETWTVVYSRATAEIAECRSHFQTEKTLRSEAGMRYRLSNETEKPLLVIEVQAGNCLGEDGEVRYEDI
jgi:mannose-6-phosphate isomerase-like protein (cupin superfamily)